MSSPGSETRSVSSAAPRAARQIEHWDPENPAFWDSQGRRIANRNLWLSIPALLLAFAVWMMFSAVAVSLPRVGFSFDTDQLFWLAALPALSGATLRIFYSFMVPLFGGRRWTAISTASLLLPAMWLAFAVADPTTPYWHFVAIAVLCGLGGGNFASSMSNISFFFPKARQGYALGMNAGLGNLGVSAVQFVIPLVTGFALFGSLAGGPQTAADGRQLFLQNAGLVWVPFIFAAAVAAWFGMNDLQASRSSFAEQSVIFRRKHNWLMCWLYVGTFGSFIGFSAGFPMLSKTLFPGVDALKYAFLGPLVGALMRSAGGAIADRVGGALLTLVVFIGMAVAVLGVMVFLPGTAGGGSFGGFLAMFLLLFVLSGVGNASTFRMIPVIFRAGHERALPADADASQRAAALRRASIESAAVIGFSSAIGAYGGFFIPKSFGSSLALTGGAEAALCGFTVFYLSCIAITWWWYFRRGAECPC